MKLMMIMSVAVMLAVASAGDTCLNPADKALIDAQGEEGAAFQKCGKACGFKADFEGCYNKCLEGDALGLSVPCAECWGAEATCSKGHCLSPCMVNAGSAACKKCSADYCGDDLFECSGIHIGGGSYMDLESNQANGDACLNEDDKAKMDAQGSEGAAFQKCGRKCGLSMDFEGCVQTCLEGDALGLSHECASCMAKDSKCSKDHCMTPCMADSSGVKCKQCSIDNCGDDLYKCSGLKPALMATIELTE